MGLALSIAALVSFVILRAGRFGKAVRGARRSAAAAPAALPGASPFAPAGASPSAPLKPTGVVHEGDAAPALILPELEGRSVDLAGLHGRVVVLDVWATWCPPCMEEMPLLERLSRSAGKDIAVVTVSVDDDDAALRAVVSRLGLTLTVLRDPGGHRMAAWGTVKYPETWVIDRDGRVRSRVIGAAAWDSPDALARLQAIATQGS